MVECYFCRRFLHVPLAAKLSTITMLEYMETFMNDKSTTLELKKDWISMSQLPCRVQIAWEEPMVQLHSDKISHPLEHINQLFWSKDVEYFWISQRL